MVTSTCQWFFIIYWSYGWHEVLKF